MSIFEELIERIDSEMKEGAETFSELSFELQNEFKRFQLDAIPKDLVGVRKKLMNSLTSDELMRYFDKRFQEITVPEKDLTVKKKLIGILLEDL